MDIRHLATKGFDKGVEISRSLVYNGVPVVLNLDTNKVESEYTIARPEEESIGAIQSIRNGREALKSSKIGPVIFKDDSLLSLSQIYDYKVDGKDSLSSVYPVGSGFADFEKDSSFMKDMAELSVKMFPNTNPNTGKPDVDKNSFYAPYIPLVHLTGCMPAQSVGDDAYFNPDGTVSIAEFLDGLNSIKYGSNSNQHRKKTLDNVSTEEDYFNEGYQSCISGISSPFFNLYTRKELIQPITRIELAYITVICWNQFIDKFNAKYGSQYYLGINFDWRTPGIALKKYVDGFDYRVSQIKVDSEYNVISLNIKDYKADRTMEEYKSDLKSGRSPIPLPMLMSLVELGVINAFHFENNRLDPLREVSRGELCYFLAKLASLFPSMYIKEAS